MSWQAASVLAIAGSDSSGGAGVQADIKTICAHRLFAQSAITALTAQNTCGVSAVLPIAPEFIEAQIDAVFEDIRPQAVKIGMLPSAEAVRAVAAALSRHGAANVVLDPVMVATSGSSLSTRSSIWALAERLVPLADVVTPNLAEARALAQMADGACGVSGEGGADGRGQVGGCGAEGDPPAGRAPRLSCASHAEREASGRAIARLGARAVLVKGGHAACDADDVLVRADGRVRWYSAERVDNPNAHGTGCTLSSAIACGLALGLALEDAVQAAKGYVAGALRSGLDLGQGAGPLDHMWEYGPREEPR